MRSQGEAWDDANNVLHCVYVYVYSKRLRFKCARVKRMRENSHAFRTRTKRVWENPHAFRACSLRVCASFAPRLCLATRSFTPALSCVSEF